MGKPSMESEPFASPNPHLGEGTSAISLQTTLSDPPITRYFDDDPPELGDDDLPPLYSDTEHLDRSSNASIRAAAAHLDGSGPVDPLLPASARGLKIATFARNKKTETTYYVDQRLATDPAFLQDQLTKLSHVPPRPFVQVRGTHSQVVKKGDRNMRTQVVDFDVQVELTHLLYTDIHAQQSWRALRTAGNFEKVRRGTVFAVRAPGFGGSGGAIEEGQPAVDLWCHRFCASNYGLRCFALERRISGWDFDALGDKVESLVRATNYRGHVKVTFPVHNARVEMYNDCRTNRWRLTKWIEALFVFTLMFLLAWPWIFFRTRRWETIYAEWPMSRVEDRPDGSTGLRYAAMSEDRWYNQWARVISKAVVERRQGTLDQGDLQRAEGGPARSDGAAGAVQVGVDAMGVVNRSFGWGADTL